jgi:hypothetical protein
METTTTAALAQSNDLATESDANSLSLSEMNEIIGGTAVVPPPPPSTGTFIDEYVWLPPLKPGQFEFVIDEICKEIRSSERWRDLPVIFVTGETGVRTRLNCFRAGADDYLPKPIVAEELIARVRIRLERSRLMRERSDKDNLSGLLNRRAFTEHSEEARSISHRLLDSSP